MAKKKGSENRFPRLQLIEATEDLSPAASGMIQLRADESDHSLYWVDDAGTRYDAGGSGYAPGGTDVAVADGGTGASTASGARTNLGLVIGTDVAAFGGEVLDLTTAETDDTLVLAPDGAGGIEFRAEAGGGGGGGDLVFIAETIVAGASVTDITITGIPNTYRDLVVSCRARSAHSADFDTLQLRMGDGSIDTGSNYSSARTIQGSGGANLGGRNQSSINLCTVTGATATANAFGGMRFTILDYASTSIFKVIEGVGYTDGATDHYVSVMGGMYKVAAAEVNQLRIYASANLAIGSRLTVWGRSV